MTPDNKDVIEKINNVFATPKISSRKRSFVDSKESPKNPIHVKAPRSTVYSVERIHICVICKGRKPDGRVDKEAMNLSMVDLRLLKEHYSRHFYDEGKIFEFFPVEERNKNPDGSVKDHFGNIFKYRCDKMSANNPGEPCWKSKRQKCGYKELALHNATEHELFEEIIVNDERPELLELIDQIQEQKKYKEDIEL